MCRSLLAFQLTFAGSPGGTRWTPEASYSQNVVLWIKATFPRAAVCLLSSPPPPFWLMAKVNYFFDKSS